MAWWKKIYRYSLANVAARLAKTWEMNLCRCVNVDDRLTGLPLMERISLVRQCHTKERQE